jgi:hypothetical protein
MIRCEDLKWEISQFLAPQLFFVAKLIWSIFKRKRVLRPAQHQT